MAIQTAQGGVMPNPLPVGGAAVHADSVACINTLVYGQLWGGAGTLVNIGTMRLDLQGYTAAGAMNLQVQRNGVHAPSTVSAVLVNPTVVALLPPSPRSIPQQTEILSRVKSALFDSLHDYELANPHIWNVTGTPSS